MGKGECGESVCLLSLNQTCCIHVQVVTRMGLFGLGVPEIAVIAGVAVLIFGAWHFWGASICLILSICFDVHVELCLR